MDYILMMEVTCRRHPEAILPNSAVLLRNVKYFRNILLVLWQTVHNLCSWRANGKKMYLFSSVCDWFALCVSTLQILWSSNKLHTPVGNEHELLLAQSNGGRVLHPGPQALLPWLLSVWTTTQGPSKPHFGSFHCGSHPGHLPHDGPGGVEEQAQRGDCLIKGTDEDWRYKSKHAFYPRGNTSVSVGERVMLEGKD